MDTIEKSDEKLVRKRKKLNLRGATIKESNGIKYITRRSPQILNTGTYRKIFGDFSLAQMGDCMGIFNRPSDFSLVWATGRVGVFIPVDQ